ncbi:MAG: Maf family nucleotide pyrophosphatase [Pseudoxanthomonas sp.]
MLYLASRSPRRAELLTRLGVAFASLDVEVPEIRQPDETPQDYVVRVARDKAMAGLAHCLQDAQACVLASDTEVVLGDDVFGKPHDAAHAQAMLARLSGRTHEVMTSVWLQGHGRALSTLVISEVSIATLSPQDMADYVASGEPMGKAGAYAIQGKAEQFVAHLSGSYSGVMGLPLHQTAQLLRQWGER